MTNEEKAREIVETVRKSVVQRYQIEHYKINYFDEVKDCCMEMAEWKDKQSILELGGWHTEEPTEDGWYLVDTPDFPKNCHCIVAEWDNDAKHFYSESSDFPVDFEKWKLIEMR